MITVIFYCFILFGSTFLIWLSERSSQRATSWLLLACAFLLVFVPSAIRYQIGTDYSNYLRIFESGEYVARYMFKEPAFYLLNWFLNEINAHYQWLFVTTAFIFTALIFLNYKRPNAWLMHFAVVLFLYFASFNGIRQTIASAFFLYALFCFFDKQYLRFYLLLVLAMFFHQSVIFLAIVSVIALIPLRYNVKEKIFPYLALLGLVIAFVAMPLVFEIIEKTLQLLGLTKYAGYFHNDKHFRMREYGTGLMALTKVVFCIYVIFNAKYILQEKKEYWFLILLVFLYAFSVVLANKIIIFGRMANVFVVAPIVAVYVLFNLPYKQQINRLVVIVFLTICTLAFIKDGFGVQTSYSNPKRNPYQTIFLEDPNVQQCYR